MITINNMHYVKNEPALIDSLFNPIHGHTASGTYKKTGRKNICIYLFDMQGTLFAYLCKNKNGYFAGNATQTGNEIHHQYALSSDNESALGFDGLKYSEKPNYIESIIRDAVQAA